MRRRLKVAALSALTLFTVAGCNWGSPDPTDPVNFSSVTFVNDTRSPLTLVDCGYTKDDCYDVHVGLIAPGAKTTEQMSWDPDGNHLWQVKDSQGRGHGWLVVFSPERQAGAVYNLSDATSDTSHVTRPRVSPSPDPAP